MCQTYKLRISLNRVINRHDVGNVISIDFDSLVSFDCALASARDVYLRWLLMIKAPVGWHYKNAHLKNVKPRISSAAVYVDLLLDV